MGYFCAMRKARSRDDEDWPRRWPWYVALTVIGGAWTALMFAVGFAASGESNRSLPASYYLLLFGGNFLAGAAAYLIARRAGHEVASSLRTAGVVATSAFFAPIVAIAAVVFASGSA
jgi:hypothetical protein